MDSYHATSGEVTDHDEKSISDISEDSSPEFVPRNVPSRDWKEFFYGRYYDYN